MAGGTERLGQLVGLQAATYLGLKLAVYRLATRSQPRAAWPLVPSFRSKRTGANCWLEKLLRKGAAAGFSNLELVEARGGCLYTLRCALCAPQEEAMEQAKKQGEGHDSELATAARTIVLQIC